MSDFQTSQTLDGGRNGSMQFAPRRSVGTQAVLLAIGTGLAQVITAGMYILAARLTTPAEYGSMVSVIAAATAAVGFVDFGTNSLWVREIARGALSPIGLGQKVVAKISFVTLAAAIWFALFIVAWPTTRYWALAPVSLALLINMTAQVPLRGIGRGDLVAFAVMGDRVLGGLVMGCLVLLHVDPLTALWSSLVCGSLISGAIAWRLAPSRARARLRVRPWSNPWSGAGFYGLSSLATSAQSLDLTVMSSFGSPAVAGVYGAVNRWTQPLGLLVNAFSSASVPFVARASSWKDSWDHIRSASWLPITAILACVAAFFLSPLLVPILIGSKYSGSVPVLQLLALATIPGIINQPLAGFLQALRLDRFVAAVLVGNVVVLLLLIGLLSRLYGAAGAAVAVLVTQSLVAIALLVIAVLNRNRDGR